MKEMYFTIAGCNHYYGSDFMEKGMKVKLVKEPDNEYDNEAIQVKIKGLGDDGISGTRFDREAFEEMMTQVKEGNIQVIITKDYSRLGRDYLEVGRYLEFVFPVLKVRYISVNDNYDSNNFTGATGGMEVAVKNVINMMYSRDASKKVRSARTTLAKAGKFIGPQAPYGYKRSESDKQKLVIDEEPAELLSKMETFDLDLIRQVVKRITMYDDGNIQFEWNVDDFLQVK